MTKRFITGILLAATAIGMQAFTPDIVCQDPAPSDSLTRLVQTVRSMRRPVASRPMPSKAPVASPMRVTTAAGQLLYGGVLYADSWTASNAPFGIYTSNVVAPLTVCRHYLGEMFTVQGGGFYNEGKYWFINYTVQSFDGQDYVYTTLYECDIEPFRRVKDYSLGMSNIARDLTFDPIEQKVYGIFSVGNLEARYLIGRMNLNAAAGDFAITDLIYLDDETNQVAIAADATGTVYTIGVDGNLYRLDKAQNTLVKVGTTGVRNIEVQYPQSASFDEATGTLYWAALKTDGSSALYTVNTTNGRATKVGNFPDNEEFAGICIPYIPADGAPAGLPELFPTFEDGSLSGILAFDAPKLTVGGAALSGNLDYTLHINGQEYESGQVRAGRRNHEIDVTLPDNGWYTFKVATANDAGASVSKSLRTFIGKDAPVACPSPTAINAVRSPEIALRWGKPRRGINQGYVDTLRLTYDVVRMPGEVTIATGITDTVCTDHIDCPDLHTYWYRITANHEGIAGAPAATNKVAVGHVAQVPYCENFDTDVDFSTWTVEHLNGAPLTGQNQWGTWAYTGYKGGVAQCSAVDGYAKDDWLFTPPVHLTPDRAYILRYKAMSQGNPIVPSFIEHLEVKMGSAPTASAMTVMLAESAPVNNVYGSYNDYEATIHVAAEGEYHIGFHATTPGADLMWMLNIDDVTIDPGAESNGPVRVGSLTVEPLPLGALGAVISFTAPDRTISNKPLPKCDVIDIKRGDETIKTFADVAAGQVLTFTDNAARQGNNAYTVVATANGEIGLPDTRTIFVGHDLPSAPEWVRCQDISGVPYITWERPGSVGPNGHFVDSDALTFTVTRYFSQREQQIVATDLRDTEWTDRTVNRPDQAPVAYIITAHNHLGASEKSYSNSIFVGDALTPLPLRESFPQRTSTSHLAYVSAGDGVAWGVMDSWDNPTVLPADNDGGMAVFGMDGSAPAIKEGWKSTLYTDRLDVNGAKNLCLTFSMFFNPATHNSIAVMVNTDATGWQQAAIFEADEKETLGWEKVSVPLQEYAGCRSLQLGFCGTAYDEELLFIDNILFDDMLDHNLQMTGITAPAILEQGGKARIEATVLNRGRQDAEGYSVAFLRNDIEVARQQGMRLSPGGSAVLGFDLTADIESEETNAIVAEIIYSSDQNESDNRSEQVNVFVELPRMAYVTDLKGDDIKSGTVSLTWSAPEAATARPEPVTDGFDIYEAFSTAAFGPWTTVDADGQSTWGISSGVAGQILQYPHAGEAMAWQVFNPIQAGLSTDYNPSYDPSGMTLPDWRPRSGAQMLGSFAPRSTGADDWLISPELPGDTQLVKLYARSILNLYPETFEILASKGGAEPADFTMLQRQTVGMSWTPVAVVLPEGTRRWAIRCVSYGQFALMIDDVTYAPATASPAAATLKGYNVYVDGIRVTPQPLSSPNMEVSTDGYEHRYGVTAVYDSGESRLSNVVRLGFNSIGATDVDLSAEAEYYTLQGVRVVGEPVRGIYIRRTPTRAEKVVVR